MLPSLDLDTTPLHTAPSPAEARAYRRRRGPLSGPPVRVTPCLGGVSWTTLLGVTAVITGVLGSVGAPARLVSLGWALMAVCALGAIVCARANRAGTCRREYCLAAFAARNGLRYERGPRGGRGAADLAERPEGLYGVPQRRFSGTFGSSAVEVGNIRHPTARMTGYLLVRPIGAEAAADAVIVRTLEPFDFENPADWRRAVRMIERALGA